MLSLVRKTDAALSNALEATPSGSRKLGIARSLLAIGQLSILTFTAWPALFVPTGDQPYGPICDGVSRIGIYCLNPDRANIALPTVMIVIGLVTVISGYWPRVTAWIHIWLTISLSSSISLPDGGEAVAQIVVILIAVMLVSDQRKNHWHRTVSHDSRALPVVWAASHILRLQMVWVYLNAAVAKTPVQEWQDGTAVYYVSIDPMFGTAGPFAPLVDALVRVPIFSLGFTWGAMVVEIAIALLLLGPARSRPAAFWLSVALHGAFIAVIGLWSFALVMVAAVLAATGPTITLRDMGAGVRTCSAGEGKKTRLAPKEVEQ